MNLLAFDTSTSRCVIGLLAHGQRHTFDTQAGNSHSQLLLPQCAALLSEAGIGFADLDAVAFGSGPGSFTGVRVACACAQGLALASGARLVPVGTLEALAWSVPAAGRDKEALWVVNDARMNELYVAQYRFQSVGDRPTWIEKVAPQVQTPDFVAQLDLQRFALAGDACMSVPALAAYRVHVLAPYVTPDGLLDAALAAHAQGRCVAARDAEPQYVRNKVALTEAERAGT